MKNKYMCKCTETEHIANEREKTMTEKEKKKLHMFCFTRNQAVEYKKK